jgi:hypothetical protein
MTDEENKDTNGKLGCGVSRLYGRKGRQEGDLPQNTCGGAVE